MMRSQELRLAFNTHSAKAKPQGKKRPSPLSIRLNENEGRALQKVAAGRSINSYVKDLLFDGKQGRRKATVQDYEALARALSLLAGPTSLRGSPHSCSPSKRASWRHRQMPNVTFAMPARR